MPLLYKGRKSFLYFQTKITTFDLEMRTTQLIHPIALEPNEVVRSRLNSPFDYQPSALIRRVAHRVMHYIDSCDSAVRDDVAGGKMFGVLLVRTASGELGFLAAFSGTIAGETLLDGFVPPIYDLNRGYFRVEEAAISAVNRQIDQLCGSEEYRRAAELVATLREESALRLAVARDEYAESKAIRAEKRLIADAAERLQIDRESQHQKGEIRRLEVTLRGSIGYAEAQLQRYEQQIITLKRQRQEMSNDLQCRLFESYNLVNGCGEWSSIFSIFEERFNRLPPAATGECAAPKLLHYALCNDLTPVEIGEFWRGVSPRGEVRKDRQFYGACRGKCEPILKFILQGVDHDEPSVSEPDIDSQLRTIFEDHDIVVYDKPAGMLSVKGRSDLPSVESIVQQRYPDAKLAHRLDQDTSGLLVVAKSAKVHSDLQRQFAQRTLSKSYVALIDMSEKELPSKGEISLPLRPNPLDRPRQVVDSVDGKEAVTRYEIVDSSNPQRCRIMLYPHTGRTHQLRLHCAHSQGLNSPIVGDRLYGVRDTTTPRLYLHSQSITFTHPISGERMTLSSEPTF